LGRPTFRTAPIDRPLLPVRTARTLGMLSAQATQSRPEGAAESAIVVANLLCGTQCAGSDPCSAMVTTGD
jgi:hypothetical protein